MSQFMMVPSFVAFRRRAASSGSRHNAGARASLGDQPGEPCREPASFSTRSPAPSLRLWRVQRAPPFRINLALDDLARIRGRPEQAPVTLLIPLGLRLVLRQALLGFGLGSGPA